MGKDYVKYTPKNVRKYRTFREVWQGMPVSISRFKKMQVNDLEYGLAYHKNGLSVWIPYSAAKVIEKNQDAIMIAIAKYIGRRKVVQGMRHYEGTLEDAIQDATYWNADDLSYGKGKRPSTGGRTSSFKRNINKL